MDTIKHELKETFRCIVLAFSAQVFAVMVILFVFQTDVQAKQSEISSIFQMPGGISRVTLLQFFVVAVCTSIIRFVFMSEVLIKSFKLSGRIICMFGIELLMVAFAVWQFKWFHTTNVSAWAGFLISFSICFILSVLLTIKSEKKANSDMNEALHKVQEKEE